MLLKTIRVPTLTPIGFREGNAVYTDDMPIDIEPVDHNRIKITMGGVSRIVDGVSLATAIDKVIVAHRRRNEFGDRHRRGD